MQILLKYIAFYFSNTSNTEKFAHRFIMGTKDFIKFKKMNKSTDFLNSQVSNAKKNEEKANLHL